MKSCPNKKRPFYILIIHDVQKKIYVQTGRINIFLVRYNFNKLQIKELVEKKILLIVLRSILFLLFSKNMLDPSATEKNKKGILSIELP